MAEALPQTTETALQSTDDHPSWVRQDGETGRWFTRFSRYRALGPSRSIRKVFLEEQAAKNKYTDEQLKDMRLPQHWSQHSRDWQWPNRALAWDAYVTQELDAEFLERNRLEKDERYDDTQTMRAKWRELVAAIDPNIHEIKPHEIIKMGTLINQDSRQEFEEPLKAKQKAEAGKAEGAVTFEDLVKIAQQMTPAKVEVHVHADPKPTENKPEILDGEFSEMPQNDSTEEKAGKIPRKLAEKIAENSAENNSEIVAESGTPRPTPIQFSVEETGEDEPVILPAKGSFA